MFNGNAEIAEIPLVVHEQAMERQREALWRVMAGWLVSLVVMGIALWRVAM